MMLKIIKGTWALQSIEYLKRNFSLTPCQYLHTPVQNHTYPVKMWGVTLSASLFLQSSHSYQGFTVNPTRWEWCVRDSQRGERDFHNRNHVQKQAEGSWVTTKLTGWWRQGWHLRTYLAHGSVGLTTVCWWWGVLQRSNVTTLMLWLSIALLRTASEKDPSPQVLIGALWYRNQSPIGRRATFTGLLIIPGQNKQVLLALRTNAGWKDKSCLNSVEQKPHVDIHLHFLTWPHDA